MATRRRFGPQGSRRDLGQAGLRSSEIGYRPLMERHFVVERYPHLQGLRLVPLGVLFLISAAWRAGFLSAVIPSDRAAHFWFFSGLAIAVAVSFPIRRSYRRRFGRPPRPERTRTGVVTLTMVTGAFVLTLAVPHLPGSVSLPALAIALALTYPGLSGGGLRWHYLPLAAGWFIFAWLPHLGLSRHVREVGLDVLIAVSLIVAGLGDDRILRRAMAAPREEPYARSI
jgi:hypothetical protein